MQNVRHGWRILFALGVIPSVIQLVLMHWLPESPRVMILRGREDVARETYKRIYSKATPEVIELKLRVAKMYVEATTQMQRGMTFWGRCKRLWTHKPYRRAIITVSGLQMFGQLTGFNTLLYYSGTLFGLFGFSNGAAAGLIPAGINALFVVSLLRHGSAPCADIQLIGMSIVDRVGRRRLALIGLPIMVVGMTWAIVSVYFMTAPTGHLLVAGAEYDRGLAGSLIGAIAFFVVGYGISYSHLGWYQSEFLALEIRAMGSSIATTAVWLSNLTVSVAFLTQLESLTPAGTYGLYLGFILCGYVFVYFCYPESSEFQTVSCCAALTCTEGISVDEIQNVYQDGFGVRKSEQMRAEKIAMTKRFRDEEAAAEEMPGKVQMSASSTFVHDDTGAESSKRQDKDTAVLV
jgi:SP family myo-inositol transporter-like MFS transporter 13